MAKETQAALDDLLGTRSFVCDAASFGLVSRPRLWWSTVDRPVRHGRATDCIRNGTMATLEPPVGVGAGQFEVSKAGRNVVQGWEV